MSKHSRHTHKAGSPADTHNARGRRGRAREPALRVWSDRYGENRGMWEGAAEDAAALGNCGRFLGFLKAPLDVLVDPIVKFVRERSGEIGPSIARQIEQSE